MKKGMNLKRRVSLFALFMVGIMFLSSVFTVLLDTSIAANRNVVSSQKGYTLRDADINDYDHDSNLNPDKVLSSNSVDADEKVLVMIEVDDNSLSTNYLTYAKSKYESFSDYVSSDAARSYVANMKISQTSLLRRLETQFDIEYKYSYSSFFNAFSAYVRYGDIKAIEKDEKVYNVILSESYSVPTTYASSTPNAADVATNIVKIDESTGIYDTSNDMNNGLGMIVAVLDTGLDYLHPAFNNVKGDITVNEDGTHNAKYNVSDIAQKLAAKDFAAEEFTAGLSARDVYINAKVPYGYDYADKDAEVYPPDIHGTHVAGIIAGHDDVIRGAAPAAQLAIMKVFGDKGLGSKEADIWAAIDDCVNLDVDVINMSLGLGSGFARDKDHLRTYEVYQRVVEAGINLVVAAGNDYSSGFGSTYGLNLASNPDSGTVGSPSSYDSAISVASISGVKTPYLLAYDKVDKAGNPTNGLSIYYTNPSDNNGEELDFIERLLGDDDRKVFDYVVIPGIGTSADYLGYEDEVKGNIVVVKRGIDTFITKVEVAAAFGAAGIIIRNNVSGIIRMSLGNRELLPACSIKMDAGDELYNRAQASSAAGKGEGGKMIFDKSYKAGPFMSDFSGWGPIPSLEIKPEITAHGGDITSANIGGDYETTSGTSMAAPNFAGVTTLLRQHVISRASDYGIDANDTVAVTKLVYQLFMSTATIAVNENSDPYSPRKQGAGLADLQKAEDTSAYLFVKDENGVEKDKTKIAVGDDKDRTGVYELNFSIRNLSTRDLTYNIQTIVMTEGLANDGKSVTETPVLLNDAGKDVKVTGGSYSKSKGTVTVSRDSSCDVTVTIRLSKANKKYLDDSFKNGMYIEGFVKVLPTATGASAVDLNIPFLGFYGDWTDAPMLDKTVYETSPDEVNDNLQEHEKNKPDVKPVLPYAKAERTQGNRLYEYYFPMGTQLYLVADKYDEVATMTDKNALSLDDDGLFMLWGVGGLLRNAKTINVKVTNSYTGHVMLEKPYQNGRKASAMSAGIIEFTDDIDIRKLLSESGVGFVEGGKYTFEMEAFLDWGDGKTYGNKNKFSFDFYVDSVAPEIVDVGVRLEKDRNLENEKRYIDIDIYDAHYAATLDLMYYNPYLKSYGSVFGTGMMPITSQRGTVTRATIDVTDVWDYVVANDYEMMVMLVDYAWNQTYQFLNIKDSYNAIQSLSFVEPYDKEALRIKTFESYDLRKILTTTATDNDRLAWDEDYVWESSNPDCVSVHEGRILGLQATGSIPTTIRVRSKANSNILAEIDVSVAPEYGQFDKIHPQNMELNHSSLVLTSGASYVLTAEITPHILTDDYKIEWTSNSAYKESWDTEDATGKTEYEKNGIGWVDVTPSTELGKENQATVTVGGIFEKDIEGIFRPSITARVYTRPKGSTDETAWTKTSIVASCAIGIKQTFIVNYHKLETYNGSMAEVVIPEDLGIETIGQGAFSGNPFMEIVKVPEGVQFIESNAFSYCELLREVYLPSTLINIGEWAFTARNPKDTEDEFAFRTSLERVIVNQGENGAKLRVIGERAFAQNIYLSEFDLSTVVSIGDAAFLYNESLTVLNLESAKTIREGAFYNCTGITDITFCDGVDIFEYAFYGCKSLTELSVPAARMGPLAFYGCVDAIETEDGRILDILGGLDKVEFNSTGPVEIGDFAFANCMWLSQIDFGTTQVKSIGDFAFAAAFYLTSITLPMGLEYIGEGAFAYSEGLKTINIPADTNLQQLGAGSLFGQYSINVDTINIHEDNPYLTTNAAKDIVFAKDDGAIVFVAPTADVANISFADANVERIAPYAFAYNTSIVNLNLTGVREIGKGAFSDCSNLRTVTGIADLEIIGEGAFENSVSLNTIDLSSNTLLTEIGVAAFAGTSLSSFAMPSNVTKISDYLFFNCTVLQTVTSQGTITEIGDYAFTGSAIRNIDLSDVTAIGEAAFMLCTSLNNVTSLESVETIADYAFQRCSALNITALESAKNIGAYAFAQCSSINNINLPAATHIGAFAFGANFFNPLYDAEATNTTYPNNVPASFNASTANLASINIPKVEFIGEGAFSYTRLVGVELPVSLSIVMPLAFTNCNFLEEIVVLDGNKNFFDDDGVLYRVSVGRYPLFDASGVMIGYSENSSELVAYPAARVADKKQATNELGQLLEYDYYNVKVGTTRIEAGAFVNSTLEYVELPYEVNAIGHQAFFGCSNLKRIDFHSHQAPALETVITSVEVTVWTALEYAYSYSVFNIVTAHYANFVFSTTSEETQNPTIVLYRPANGEGYESFMYNKFFADTNATGEYVMSAATRTLIDSINALPAISEMNWARDNETVAALVRSRSLVTAIQERYISSEVDQKLNEAKLWIENNVPTEEPDETGCAAGCGTIAPIGGDSGSGMMLGGGLMMLIAIAVFFALKKKSKAN